MTHFVFLINLLQDVNVARPLAFLAAADFDASLSFLVSDAFVKRDTQGIWMEELGKLKQQLDAELHVYDSPLTAYSYLQGKQGVLIAASESNLNAHKHTHQVLRIAPPSFLKITLQHGFECVGFLQNAEQSAGHGTNVTFAADVVCGWTEAEYLTSMAPSERPKLYVSGPPSILQRKNKRELYTPYLGYGGLVCENLHSVRFASDETRKISFMDEFATFSDMLGYRQQQLTLRPHPGGQYFLKNDVPLPFNVVLENRPMYDVDLSSFDYGISAPSTVLLDMVLAGIPAAVWRDPAAEIDTSNYAGLRMIGGSEEWLQFEQDAINDPAGIRAEQEQFLSRLGMPLDPTDVRARFARLFAGVGAQPAVIRQTDRPTRIFLVANDLIPSLAIFFLRPLHEMVQSGAIEIACVTEAELKSGFISPKDKDTANWLRETIRTFQPDLTIFCRYSGPQSAVILEASKEVGSKIIYHLDDDLLNIPIELGVNKYQFHNQPDRIASVLACMNGSDLVYASTRALRSKVSQLGLSAPIVNGPLSCSNEVRRRPSRRLHGKFGYMGFDHAHDLESILPAVVNVLSRNPSVEFEIFGPIPMPEELQIFGDRVRSIPPIPDYNAFLKRFSEIDWDVGICPLADTEFNGLKADVKWSEYTAVGVAVIATDSPVYEAACGDGCGILARSLDEWTDGLEALCTNSDLRYGHVVRAQEKLTQSYSINRLRDQTLAVMNQLLPGNFGELPGNVPLET